MFYKYRNIFNDPSTLLGLPYFLPVIFEKNSTDWKVNTRFQELPHVIHEIEKFNKVVKNNHERVMSYILFTQLSWIIQSCS